MAYINENYLKLKAGYLFPEIGRRVREFAAANPEKDIIRMGIGDVTQPLSPAILKAFHEGVEEMGHKNTFKGYGPEQGYEFLREAIATNDYNGLIKIWDIKTGECLQQISSNKRLLCSLLCYKSKLISGSSNGILCVWD